ncbi:MAG: NYN domain-containing protein [Patescibacteria group bacterium]|nr:NYN domain-containing protein [Patescibacteria group bacterium]
MNRWRDQAAGFLSTNHRRREKHRADKNGGRPKVAIGSPVVPFNANHRVLMVIDMANVQACATENDVAVDYETMLYALVAQRQLSRSVAYCVRPRGKNRGADALEERLRECGCEIETKIIREGKANWDGGMIVDVMDAIHACPREFDVLILVSGDNDFTDLVHRCHLDNLRVEVAGFSGHTASPLREAADQFTDIRRFTSALEE